MSTPTNEEKKQLLERLLSQSTFAKSPTSSVLLQYLVQMSIDDIDIKETTIGVDLLGKKYDADKGNARIRVSMYNLRKKLNTYYESEGKEDTWRIVIPKGQYRPEFVKNTGHSNSVNTKNYWIGGLVAALIISWLAFYLNERQTTPSMWKAFFDNGKPTTLFIGDSYGFMGPTGLGHVGWVRDYSINDADDLYNFLEAHPTFKDSLSPANYFYTTGMAAYASKEVARLFERHHADFSIRFTSNSNYSDIIGENSIYAGPIKNDNKFIRFFNEENSKFKLKNNSQLHYLGDKEQPDTTFQLAVQGLEFEYAIVSRLEGPAQTAQLIFFSDHDIGVKATVEYFTNADSIKAFYNRYFDGQNVPFTALFETWGIERTNTSLKPILVRKINSNQ
ncbi:MAG TPA: hypothetical protein VKA27_00645 [Sunxiuqinia sp.]|nr:hypothetical protein [Sunxiuqinia sp.]